MGKRGKAGKDKQLGQLQVTILLWLRSQLRKTKLDPWFNRYERATRRARRTDPTIIKFVLKPINDKGVRWNAKRFYDDPEPTRSREAALSNARANLEERGLIACHKSGNLTTHVKLTKLGWEAANHWDMHGLSERQMQSVRVNTTESLRHTELTEEISTRRGGLIYAKKIGDKPLEDKLLAEITERENELDSLAEAVGRARAEAIVRDHPDSPLAGRFRQLLRHSTFITAVPNPNTKNG